MVAFGRSCGTHPIMMTGSWRSEGSGTDEINGCMSQAYGWSCATDNGLEVEPELEIEENLVCLTPYPGTIQ
jgi:hypothetical protein